MTSKLIEASDILPYEEVHGLNANNGARFITYAIEGEKGEIYVNGSAARLVTKGDIILTLTYRYVEDTEARHFKSKLIYVDASNIIAKTK